MPERWKPENSQHESSESRVEGLNIYNKAKFAPEQARERLHELAQSFKDRYRQLGYHEQAQIPISSGFDPTVRFIGSHISVLKPYLTEDRVPMPGVFMQQPCLRTRNADKLLDDDFAPNWGSYFLSMGALAHPDRLGESCEELFDYFEKDLVIDKQNILVRACSMDTDLIAACASRYGKEKIEIDAMPLNYYRHKIGTGGIVGRNFNLALRNSNGEGFSDVGNVISLNDGTKTLGIEIALGTSTILKCIYGLDHVQDCHPVTGLGDSKEGIFRKFQDAVMTSVVLCREGLRPFGQHNRNRILKQYLRSLSYFRKKSSLDIDGLQRAIQELEAREFPGESGSVAVVIAELVAANERDLMQRTELSADDLRVKSVLTT